MTIKARIEAQTFTRQFLMQQYQLAINQEHAGSVVEATNHLPFGSPGQPRIFCHVHAIIFANMIRPIPGVYYSELRTSYARLTVIVVSVSVGMLIISIADNRHDHNET